MLGRQPGTRRAADSRAQESFTRGSAQWERGKLQSAFRLFLAAAKAGDEGAQINLGYFYDVGIGVKRNRGAALYWRVAHTLRLVRCVPLVDCSAKG